MYCTVKTILIPASLCVSGVLKDFLRELPEPLFTNALYHMLVDAASVRMPADPRGSARLMLSVLECLPKANQVCPNLFLIGMFVIEC